MSRPRGLRVRRDTHAAERPNRARATAVFSSAPPIWTSRLLDCSNLRKLGGLRRIIASPQVTTSCAMGSLSSSRLLTDGHILTGQLADAVEVAFRDCLRLDQLRADAETARAGLQELCRGGEIDPSGRHQSNLG